MKNHHSSSDEKVIIRNMWCPVGGAGMRKCPLLECKGKDYQSVCWKNSSSQFQWVAHVNSGHKLKTIWLITNHQAVVHSKRGLSNLWEYSISCECTQSVAGWSFLLNRTVLLDSKSCGGFTPPQARFPKSAPQYLWITSGSHWPAWLLLGEYLPQLCQWLQVSSHI